MNNYIGQRKVTEEDYILRRLVETKFHFFTSYPAIYYKLFAFFMLL